MRNFSDFLFLYSFFIFFSNKKSDFILSQNDLKKNYEKFFIFQQNKKQEVLYYGSSELSHEKLREIFIFIYEKYSDVNILKLNYVIYNI